MLKDVQAAAEKQGVVISAIAVEVDRDKIVSEANRILNSQ